MTTIARRRSKASGVRIPDSPRIPSLSEMIRDGQASHARIRRSTREALIEWFAQSERLNIARTHYGLRGDRFRDFARRIGVDRSSAFELVKLHQHRAAIMSRCLDQQEQATARGEPYSFPGWQTALGSIEQRSHRHRPMVIWHHGSDEWEAPAALFDFLDGLFHFDVDVCASPQNAKCRKFFSKDQNGLAQPWLAGRTYWMNAPYSQAGKWAQKAAAAAKGGAVVVGLFANRSSTAWYREYVAPSAMMVQLQGRLQFTHQGRTVAPGSMSEAPFPSMLAIWPRKAGTRLMPYCTPISAALLQVPE
jgi:site-specific DNA-methyltransferase (adenine-specific)